MNYRLQIIEALGGQCMWRDENGLGCGMLYGHPIDDPDMLHVEHVNGKGGEHRREFHKDNHAQNGTRGSGWTTYYKYIYEHLDTGNYQLLCANHHALKTAMEQRQRKQAQALAKGQKQPVSDTNTYENKTTRAANGSNHDIDTYDEYIAHFENQLSSLTKLERSLSYVNYITSENCS